MTGRKTVQSSKGQILLGGGFSRIIIDPLARRIHEVARPSAERDRAIVCREFTWLLLIYYKPAGFTKDHTAATCLLCRRLRREKVPPFGSIRCQLESARNLLSEVYGHATL